MLQVLFVATKWNATVESLASCLLSVFIQQKVLSLAEVLSLWECHSCSLPPVGGWAPGIQSGLGSQNAQAVFSAQHTAVHVGMHASMLHGKVSLRTSKTCRGWP